MASRGGEVFGTVIPLRAENAQVGPGPVEIFFNDYEVFGSMSPGEAIRRTREAAGRMTLRDACNICFAVRGAHEGQTYSAGKDQLPIGELGE